MSEQPLRSKFLRSLLAAFKSKSKSLRYGTKSFGWDIRNPKTGEEELRVALQPAGSGPTMTLLATGSNRIHLTIVSNGRRDRGKCLLSIEGLLVPDNAPCLLQAFETAVSELRAQECDFSHIESVWKSVSLRAID